MSNSNTFVMPVEDIFNITGRGTLFCGKIQSGSISKYTSVVCRTQEKELNIRVIEIRETGTDRMLETANAGASVGVLGQEFKLEEFGPRGTVRLVAGNADTQANGESSSSLRGLLVSIAVVALIALLYFFLRG